MTAPRRRRLTVTSAAETTARMAPRLTPDRPTTTTHAPSCERPGWDIERYALVWVLRCRGCGAIQLAQPGSDLGAYPGGDR